MSCSVLGPVFEEVCLKDSALRFQRGNEERLAAKELSKGIVLLAHRIIFVEVAL